MAKDTLIDFEVRHAYRSGFVLDLSFSVKGPMVALVGPSGTGKTTVLALISGLIRPDHGVIKLGDETFVDTTAGVFLAPERRGVGVVFQEDLLFPHRTVKWNLLFGWKRRGAAESDRAVYPKPEEVIEVLELESLLDRKPSTLSGGQARRVALGRALLRGPRLLMLDEPLTGLDPSLQQKILEYLERSLAAWGIPTLLVSHDRESVRRLSHEVVELTSDQA